MGLRFQNFNEVFEFWIFVKRVNNGVSGTCSEKTEFVFDFNEIMKNKNFSKERRLREFFNLAQFHKDRMILLGDLLDYFYMRSLIL